MNERRGRPIPAKSGWSIIADLPLWVSWALFAIVSAVILWLVI